MLLAATRVTTMDQVLEIEGVRVLICAGDGVLLRGAADANDFLSAAWSRRADLLVIPVERLGPDFLKLRSRVAGEVFQKFANYRLRCAIVGDITAALAGSAALQDFVRETNAGTAVWFVADLDQLRARIAAGQGSPVASFPSR
jgi:hypothetical protein